jgi:hypothetical protein
VDRVAAWLIALIGFVYLFIGIQLIFEGKMGLGVSFIFYGCANAGLYMAAKGM